MDQAISGFVATVSLRNVHIDAKERLAACEEFWRPVQEALPRTDATLRSVEQLEETVISGFPRLLHRYLLQHFESGSIRSNEWVTRHPRELDAVFFRVSVEVARQFGRGGAQDLAELLKGNLDTFTMLTETFVPIAFAGSIPSSHGASDFSATISPTAELERTFARQRLAPDVPSPAPIAAARDTTTEGAAGWPAKVPRALLATAFSLLTPVLLSLIVLYCAAQLLLQDRSELTKRETILVSEEKDLRKTERSAAADLQKENVELLRLLRAPAAPASSKP
jgi:hypothetical protein